MSKVCCVSAWSNTAGKSANGSSINTREAMERWRTENKISNQF